MALEDFQSALRIQAVACKDLGSPFTARVLTVISKNVTELGDVWALVVNWPGDLGPSGASVPLRLAGTLNAIVLEGLDPELVAVYPPNSAPCTDLVLWDAIEKAISRNTSFALKRLQSPPQTNEVRRSGIIVPGFLAIADKTGLSNFVMSEVGASAGLNLIWDTYRYTLADKSWGNGASAVHLSPKWKGEPPIFREITVIDRDGCDLLPVDLEDEQERRRLLSYIWPDQDDRVLRTKQAIESFRKSTNIIKAEDAISWLERRLSQSYEGAVHVVYNTIAWQYFPEDKKKEGEIILQRAGALATEDAPLAWLSLEADGKGPGAALMLSLWPAGETYELARGDFHGRWVDWKKLTS